MLLGLRVQPWLRQWLLVHGSDYSAPQDTRPHATWLFWAHRTCKESLEECAVRSVRISARHRRGIVVMVIVRDNRREVSVQEVAVGVAPHLLRFLVRQIRKPLFLASQHVRLTYHVGARPARTVKLTRIPANKVGPQTAPMAHVRGADRNYRSSVCGTPSTSVEWRGASPGLTRHWAQGWPFREAPNHGRLLQEK